VTSLNRPGANITGIVNLAVSLISKRVELMHEFVPNAKTIAVLVNPTTNSLIVESVRANSAVAERTLGIKVEILQADTLSGIERRASILSNGSPRSFAQYRPGARHELDALGLLVLMHG
jgi:ABC-type uncharacterized transport system substrate-binding protein